ncbi:response regulator transcription factor [Pedobacter nyackensis]|uniref:Regulatory protein, luxR family n=1 Tax=Pedobacter nyackensis TaxID=475255 RepID=A0A1W2EF61_9SPHI|nr:helix-turn-helix transcriptional regulator [Pedobacter nyackensis]SMD08305.1 regulatory protein, luxR family [Pedobacter nyackensis]
MDSLSHLTPSELYRLAGYSSKSRIGSSNASQRNNISENIVQDIGSAYCSIFNWATMQYTFISDSVKNVLGYNIDAFFERGLNFTFSIIHSIDMRKLREVHLAIFSYYYKTAPTQRSRLRFSYNLRIKTASNDYIQILRQSTFIDFTDDGKPTMEYIYNTNITGFKFNNYINLTIHQLSESGVYVLCHEQEFSDSYPKLSERERQVVELVRKGLLTKEIADQLNLSIETVKSHRKHIIAKTGACNMTAAINMIRN